MSLFNRKIRWQSSGTLLCFHITSAYILMLMLAHIFFSSLLFCTVMLESDHPINFRVRSLFSGNFSTQQAKMSTSTEKNTAYLVDMHIARNHRLQSKMLSLGSPCFSTCFIAKCMCARKKPELIAANDDSISLLHKMTICTGIVFIWSRLKMDSRQELKFVGAALWWKVADVR